MALSNHGSAVTTPPHVDDAMQKQHNLSREYQQVVVLAGGCSSRLSALTETPSLSCTESSGSSEVFRCSKALLPVANRPMIWYCLKSLQESRFKDVIVVTEAREQQALLSYLRVEFADVFQRLEVVALRKDRSSCLSGQSGRNGGSHREKKQEWLAGGAQSSSTPLSNTSPRTTPFVNSKREDAVDDDPLFFLEHESNSEAKEATSSSSSRCVVKPHQNPQQSRVGSSSPLQEKGGLNAGDEKEEEVTAQRNPAKNAAARDEDADLKLSRMSSDSEPWSEDNNDAVQVQEEITEDDDEKVCGTAEALLQIKHMLYTDFFVVPCDLIGHVDFFALANLHRMERAACSAYLLPRNFLAQQAADLLQGVDKKRRGGGGGPQQQPLSNFTTTGCNAVAIAFDASTRHLLSIQDRRSVSHGAELRIPKLALFYHPCIEIRGDLYDPHVYLLKSSVLRLLGSPRMRDLLSSIRFDLVPYLALMQETPIANVWANSRLDCDMFDNFVETLEDMQQSTPAAAAAAATAAAAAATAAEAASAAEAAAAAEASQLLEKFNIQQDYTLASPPPEPRKGSRVVFTLHPNNAGIACRANNLEDYYEINMKFCGARGDELRSIMPEWMLPQQSAKKPPNTRDSVVGEGGQFDESAVVKRSVIGADVHIAAGARVTTCVIMEKAIIMERAVVQRCILGKQSEIGSDCKLTSCQIRHGYKVPANTVAVDEILPA